MNSDTSDRVSIVTRNNKKKKELAREWSRTGEGRANATIGGVATASEVCRGGEQRERDRAWEGARGREKRDVNKSDDDDDGIGSSVRNF